MPKAKRTNIGNFLVGGKAIIILRKTGQVLGGKVALAKAKILSIVF